MTGQPVTTWQQNIELDPTLQAGMDAQQDYQKMLSEGMQGALPGAMESAMKGYDFGVNPAFQFGAPEGAQRSFDYNKIAPDYREQAQEAVWNRMQPAFQQRRSDTENQLANMGLTRGSEAWNREMARLDESEAQGRLQAIEAGRAEAGQGLQAQQQGYEQALGSAGFGNEALKQDLTSNIQYGEYQKALREMGLGEQTLANQQGISVLSQLQDLFGGTGGYDLNAFGFSPGAQYSAVGAQGPDLSGAAQSQYQAGIDKYNAKAGQTAATVGTIATIAAAF